MKTDVDNALLNSAQEDLWEIRGKLCKLQEKLAPFPYGACAHEISQTLRCLGIAEDQIKRTRNPEPLPTLEDVHSMYNGMYKVIEGAKICKNCWALIPVDATSCGCGAIDTET